ncbi:hypothetical protein [Streptomyces sp. VRA16 Mangrove soil]|uniref:hypothetical protein n=1 Tax=Streptomyces sp. VRA16 Mangrove soil TaxID=2817434 RepID=UPI001E3930E0|nr:hypothetical protein [Streptomyces sp. VRA16 Mangrove soil]
MIRPGATLAVHSPPCCAASRAFGTNVLVVLVASGACVHPLGEIAARYNSPPGVVFVPVVEAPPMRWALTWRTTADSPVVRALAQTAAEVGPVVT